MTEQTENQNGISIFRFEPDDCKRMEQLRYNKLWISDPATFNDPSDLRLMIKDQIDTSFTYDNFKKIIKFIYGSNLIDDFFIIDESIRKKLKEWYEGEMDYYKLDYFSSMISERLLTFGVLCLSKSYEIPLNWSHYSNGYKGFCIEYQLNKLSLYKYNNDMSIYDVIYSNNLPKVCISEILLTPRQAMQKLLATKTLEWAYEQECRLVHFGKQGEAIDMPAGLKIVRLIAGEKMSNKHLQILIESARILNVPVDKIRRNILDKYKPEWIPECLFNPLPPP